MVLLENADCLFVCHLYCPSLFISLLCDLLVLVAICEDKRRYNVLLLGVCMFIIQGVRKRLYPFLFFFSLGAQCVESGVSCTDCY